MEGYGFFKIEHAGFSNTGPFYVGLNLPALEGRVVVTAWTRADSSTVALSAVYEGTAGAFATVQAVPTGRRTSDDWVELSTGPIDSVVMGNHLTRVSFSGQFSNMVFDALEVHRVGNLLIPENTACTVDRVEDACGSYGDCIMGQCVDSALVWGQVPQSAAMRDEYMQRVAHIFLRLHANRSAVSTRGNSFVTVLQGLARTDSPRHFFGGLTDAVSSFRDGHTSAPMPYAGFYSSIPSTLGSQNSGALGACFGLTQLDLLGGRRGYTVFTVGTGGLLSVPLQVGDVLTHIDGTPVDSWMAGTNVFGRGVPSDPRSEPAYLALDLPGVLSMRAHDITLLRCASPTDCATPQVLQVEVARPIREAVLAAGDLRAAVSPFQCDGRFTNSVSALAPPASDGSDVISSEKVGEVMAIQFNGFSGDTPWDDAVGQALAGNQTHVLMDARLGNGGYVTRVAYMVGQLRDETSPRYALGVGRPWDAVEPEGYFDSFVPCLDQVTNNVLGLDRCAQSMAVTTGMSPAPAAGARVAWLNSADISGNDYAPRLLTGRSNLRIFGPHVTAGAFGAITSLPPLLPSEYSGGSIQVHDTRFADDKALLVDVPYNSGTGVAPDEVLLQKLSDSLRGTDTMLTRARAWLLETP
jgi:hypothetical protein